MTTRERTPGALRGRLGAVDRTNLIGECRRREKTMTDLAVEPTVTTGPIAGSSKIYRELEISPGGPAAKVPFRRVNLSNGEHLHLYDTSGPYTDSDAVIDVATGLSARPGVVR